jgi:serine/threonine protein kinase
MQPELRYRKDDKIGGRYQVHKALAGGMGEVYLCLDLQDNIPLALKTFQARYLASPKARTYFEREAATWVSLEKHPNVVRCFYMDTVDHTPFLFLEWVAGAEGDGTDLRDWLNRRGPLEPRRALEFTLDVCRALVHAQRKVPGFVHCDIKPDNVLVAQGQLAKLTDFGLAKFVREAGLVPLDGAALAAGGRWQVSSAGGTPPYMAPEQWKGEAVDARTDVYAVGCLLYELLTRRWPFTAETLEELKRRHLEAPPPPLEVGLRGLQGEGLDRLLARCLAKEKGERYPSTSELMGAIAGLYEAWHGAPPRDVPDAEDFTAIDYCARGATYRALGRHSEALADFEAAIRLDPNFAIAHSNRGITYRTLGRHSEALNDYEAAIRLDPNPAIAHSNRGITYQALGRHSEALADYEAAIRLDPNFASAYLNKGVLHTQRNEWDDALNAFETAARLGDARGARYAAQVRQIRELPPPPAADLGQQAFEAFIEAASPDALRQALDRHPFMAQPDLLAALEQFVAQRLDAHQRPFFRQRLDWLRQLTAPKPNP